MAYQTLDRTCTSTSAVVSLHSGERGYQDQGSSQGEVRIRIVENKDETQNMNGSQPREAALLTAGVELGRGNFGTKGLESLPRESDIDFVKQHQQARSTVWIISHPSHNGPRNRDTHQPNTKRNDKRSRAKKEDDFLSRTSKTIPNLSHSQNAVSTVASSLP